MVVGDYSNTGRQQRVIVQAEANSRATAESVLELYVSNDQGEQVPFSAFATTQWSKGPVQLSRYNGYPAFKIGGDAAPGVSSGDAMAAMEQIISTLPEGIGYEWTALSYQEKFASGQAPKLLALSILVVFLLLVAFVRKLVYPVISYVDCPNRCIRCSACRTCRQYGQ